MRRLGQTGKRKVLAATADSGIQLSALGYGANVMTTRRLVTELKRSRAGAAAALAEFNERQRRRGAPFTLPCPAFDRPATLCPFRAFRLPSRAKIYTTTTTGSYSIGTGTSSHRCTGRLATPYVGVHSWTGHGLVGTDIDHSHSMHRRRCARC